jgi:hypothetical protein
MHLLLRFLEEPHDLELCSRESARVSRGYPSLRWADCGPLVVREGLWSRLPWTSAFLVISLLEWDLGLRS